MKWTKEEDKYLLENYDTSTKREIGEKLGRTRSAMSARMFVLKKKAKQSAICKVKGCFAHDKSFENNCRILHTICNECKFYKIRR